MVWRIFAWHALGLLVPIAHCLNASTYLNIVAEHVHPFMTTVYTSCDGNFQRDNTIFTKFKSSQTVFFLTRQWVNYTVLKLPPRSLDLWDVVEQEIHIIDVHRCTDLPFSLELSPRTFTKCVDAALAPLHLQSIRIMNYIDDWLILAQSHQLAVRHRNVVLAHMKELGLWLNAKKCAFSTTDDHFSASNEVCFLHYRWPLFSIQRDTI